MDPTDGEVALKLVASLIEQLVQKGVLSSFDMQELALRIVANGDVANTSSVAAIEAYQLARVLGFAASVDAKAANPPSPPVSHLRVVKDDDD